MSWGKRIAAARKAAGLTQEELASQLYVVQTTVAAWETEKNEPSIAAFKSIAAATQTTPEWLAFGVGDGPAKIAG